MMIQYPLTNERSRNLLGKEREGLRERERERESNVERERERERELNTRITPGNVR